MASYKLLYWPGIPGRGEYIRLAFEAAQVAYEDVKDIPTLRSVSEDVPAFAVPALECTSASGKTFKTSQTGAILNFLAPRLGLAGSAKDADEETKEFDRTKVNAITLTILDLSNEVHDSHHPMCALLSRVEACWHTADAFVPRAVPWPSTTRSKRKRPRLALRIFELRASPSSSRTSSVC